MIEAGLPLAHALGVMGRETRNKHSGKIIDQINQGIKSGLT